MPKDKQENSTGGEKDGFSRNEESALAAAKYAARFEGLEEEGEKEEKDASPAKAAGEIPEDAGKEQAESEAENMDPAPGDRDPDPEDTESDPEEKKDKKDRLIEELEDRLRRNMAEFDNFRKRTDKEKAGMFAMGAAHVAEKILPVLDNFERALTGVPEDPEAMAYAKGIDMIYRQFLKVLEELGVTPIDCLGKEFDPGFHNAVMHVEDEKAGDNTIIEELQKGYMYKDTVLRYSMVKVAN